MELAADDVVALDAASFAGSVPGGFARLHPEGSDDPRVRWKAAPADLVVRPGPDDLVDDAIFGGTLHLDLAPGRWTVAVLLGRGGTEPGFAAGTAFGVRAGAAEALRVDVPSGAALLASPFYAANPFPIFRPDETFWDRQVAPHWPWRRFSIDVPDGGVDLSVFGTGLAALIAAPAADPAALEVHLATADLVRRARFAPASLPATDGEGVHVAGWREMPDATKATPSPRLDRDAAPGERVSAVFWLFPGDAAGTVTLEGLPGFRAAEVHFLDQSSYPGRAWRPRPAFLRPTEGALRGGQGVPVGVAITGAMPDRDVAGAVVVTRGDRVIRVPVTLRARALTLDPGVPVGFFVALRPELPDRPDVGAMTADLALMREIGARALGLVDAVRIGAAGGPDWRRAASLTERWRALGGDTVVWGDGVWLEHALLAWPDAPFPHTDRLPAVLAAAADADAAFWMHDEGGGRRLAHAEAARSLAATLRSAHPTVPLAGANPHPIDWALPLERSMQTLLPTPSRARWSRLRRGDRQVWAYNLTPGRSASGLLPWAWGADGLMQWHWNQPSGDPFQEAPDELEYQYALLAPDGAIWPTVLLESFAEGVVDQRYLATLERLVRERRRGTARARALLDAARAADGRSPAGPYDGEAWSDDALARLRDAIGDEAERLARP